MYIVFVNGNVLSFFFFNFLFFVEHYSFKNSRLLLLLLFRNVNKGCDDIVVSLVDYTPYCKRKDHVNDITCGPHISGVAGCKTTAPADDVISGQRN